MILPIVPFLHLFVMPPRFQPTVVNVKCCKCDKTAYPQESITYDQNVYHTQSCFKCEICRSSLSLTAVAKLNNVLYCKPCFKKTFLKEGRYSSFSGGSASSASAAPKVDSSASAGSTPVAAPVSVSVSASASVPASIPEDAPAPASADGVNPLYSRAGLRSTVNSISASSNSTSSLTASSATSTNASSPFKVTLKSTSAASTASPARPNPLSVEPSSSVMAAASLFGASNFGRNRSATTGPGFSKSAPQSPTFSSQHGPFSVGKSINLSATKNRNSDPALDAILKGPNTAATHFQQVGVVKLFEKKAGQTLLEYAFNNNKASAIALIELLSTQIMVAENQLFSLGQRSPFSAAPIAAPLQDTPSTEVVSLDEIVGGN
jgi:hypothetical protein